MDYSNVSTQAQYDYRNKLAAFQETGKTVDEKIDAVLYAQAVEMQLLKAPATAVFPPADQVSVTGYNGSYTISSFVDSQNSYGASVRTPFTLHVTKDPGGSWRCTDKFTSTEANVQAKVIGNTVMYWILGLALTAIGYFVISNLYGF